MRRPGLTAGRQKRVAGTWARQRPAGLRRWEVGSAAPESGRHKHSRAALARYFGREGSKEQPTPRSKLLASRRNESRRFYNSSQEIQRQRRLLKASLRRNGRRNHVRGHGANAHRRRSQRPRARQIPMPSFPFRACLVPIPTGSAPNLKPRLKKNAPSYVLRRFEELWDTHSKP